MRTLAVSIALILLPDVTAAADCAASSTDRPTPLLELYTSEGCDSCPPADRFVSELRARDPTGHRAVVLAFHVDYWDKLGWIDRYAQSRFSERQQIVNSRIGSRVVYTPQLVLNGKDYRRAARDDFEKRLDELRSAKARAAIQLALVPGGDRVDISGAWSAAGAQHAQGWLALYENRLESDVTSGENRNKRLKHDFVVRDIAGPFASGAISHAFKLNPEWKRADLGVASFVQDP